MPRQARIALLGAATGAALLALTWYLTHYSAPLRRADMSILSGFEAMQRPRLNWIANRIAGLCDPGPYALLAAIPIGVSLVRRRMRVAAAIAVVLLGASATTELVLKPLLVGPRDLAPGGTVSWASMPSGHATAAMALALCCVIAAPPRRRPLVAAAMGAFAVAVCWSFLVLGWHYPSDVLAGFLVSAIWALGAVASLWTLEARLAGRPRRAARRRTVGSAAPSVRQALAPSAVLVAGAVAAVALMLIARRDSVVAFAGGHTAVMVGAGAIGVLGLALQTGMALILRRA
ncbi:MAG: phosphatase PAP2 family protein [Solirubrobacteraceae bacterium]